MKHALKISQSSQAANVLRDYMSGLDHEEMWGLFLNRDNRLISKEMLTKGTLTYTPIDARTIIKHSLLKNATGVIIIHNHPSGNPNPSQRDIEETLKINKACKLMDIALLDHIVICKYSYYSFADETTIEY